jgi:hypothetical protein
MFNVSYSVRPYQAFLTFSLMFVSKARAYPSEAPFRDSTLEKAPDLAHTI